MWFAPALACHFMVQNQPLSGLFYTDNQRNLTQTKLILPCLRAFGGAAKLKGPRIHDARIAALCPHHGVRELWSADRDFSAFPQLMITNPLVTR